MLYDSMARLPYDTLVFPLSSETVCDYLASTVQLVATRRTNPHCPLEKYPHLMWMTPNRSSRGAGSDRKIVGSRAHTKGPTRLDWPLHSFWRYRLVGLVHALTALNRNGHTSTGHEQRHDGE